VLGRILAQTRDDLRERRRRFPRRLMASAPTPRGQRSFVEAIGRPGRVNVIAEFKRRSPSRGSIREDLHPVRVAQAYEVAGAAALSVLTEARFFGGSLDDLQEHGRPRCFPRSARTSWSILPVWEAWYAGADAVLLIVAALDDSELADLKTTVEEARLQASSRSTMPRICTARFGSGPASWGQHRDLRTLEVRLETSLALAPLIPDEVVRWREPGFVTARTSRACDRPGSTPSWWRELDERDDRGCARST